MKKKLLEIALQHAQMNLQGHPDYRHYCHWTFIVQNNKIVEYGENREGTPPLHFGYRPLSKLHSEFVAYKRARGLLTPEQNWSIINVRLNREGEMKIAAPCATCWGWLTAVGCDKAYFTTECGWGRV